MSRTTRVLGALLSRPRFAVHALNWALDGLPTPPPPAIKRARIAQHMQASKLDIFVETGTFRGGTLAHIARLGVKCHSIELDEWHHANAVKRFAATRNVDLIKGDSAIELPRLIEKLPGPAVFWLDGHYSAGSTASADIASPIVPEIEAILSWRHGPRSTVLIDDVDAFTGSDGYPRLGVFLAELEARGAWSIAVNCGMIELTHAKG